MALLAEEEDWVGPKQDSTARSEARQESREAVWLVLLLGRAVGGTRKRDG